MTTYYHLGKEAACTKLGIRLTFDSAQDAQEHARSRRSLGNAAGVAGSVLGGVAGGMAGGSMGGVPGSLAGGVAGSELGGRLAAMPATTLMDVAHDIPYRARKQHARTEGQLNAAAGMPTGAR